MCRERAREALFFAETYGLVPQALQVSDKSELLHKLDQTTENEGQGSSSFESCKLSYKVTYNKKKGLKTCAILSFAKSSKMHIYIYNNGLNIWFYI